MYFQFKKHFLSRQVFTISQMDSKGNSAQRFCYIYQLQRGANNLGILNSNLEWMPATQADLKSNRINDYSCQFLPKFICCSVFVFILCSDELLHFEGNCFITSRFFIYSQMLLFYRVR